MRINFDFLDLEAFLAVAELGSFQRAAEQLAISQSAITRRIQKLETALDTILFERTTRSLKLTLEARSFRSRAQEIMDNAAEAMHAMSDESTRFEHQRNSIITIAAIPTTTHDILPQVIKHFRATGHTARIKILDYFANDVIEAVTQGEADFGISFIGMQEPGLIFEYLFEDQFVLAMHRDHPFTQRVKISWHEIEGEQIIVPWKGTGNRMLIDNEMATIQQQLDWSYQVHHSSSAIGLVEANLGVALLPQSAVPQRENSLVASRPLKDPEITRIIGTVRRSQHVLSVAAEAFYQILIDECQKIMPS